MSGNPEWPVPPWWAKVGLTCTVVILSALIALNTGYGLHPDERLHVAAFRYFETHWWPPELGADELVYSPDGTSRVFFGEVVYLVYGKMAHLILTVLDISDPTRELQTAYTVYRLLNTLLLAGTLIYLFTTRRRVFSPALLGAVMVCIPQVIYVYSYANSDAWAFTMTIILFVYALGQTEEQPWTAKKYAQVGLLLGLVLAAKPSFWPVLPFILAPLGQPWLTGLRVQPFRFLTGSLLAITALFLVAGPLRVIYPLTQKNYAQKYEAMREAKAREDFKPSQITYPGYRLAQRGEPFSSVGGNPYWYKASAQSLYGVFGYFNTFLPDAMYWLAAGAALAMVGLTAWGAGVNWSRLPTLLRVLLISAPVAMGLNVLASLYNSWIYDVQPQGRYLFGGLIPLAVLCFGMLPWESQILRRTRWMIVAFFFGLNVYALTSAVLLNPALSKS
ncbi:MAG: DUF2142 domain-containing protein [Caldilineae bacterium]|nr:MAG: DUF2142 domain-containing protein [Caldilineae bacterium]